MLRVKSRRMFGDDQFVQDREISLGGGDDDVSVRAMSSKRARVIFARLHAHGYFAQCVNPFRDRMDAEFEQRIGRFHDSVHRLVRCIHRPRSYRSVHLARSIRAPQAHGRGRHAGATAGDHYIFECKNLLRLIELVGDERLKVGVRDVFLLVCELFETIECLIEIGIAETIAQLTESRFEGMAARVFAQDQTRR